MARGESVSIEQIDNKEGAEEFDAAFDDDESQAGDTEQAAEESHDDESTTETQPEDDELTGELDSDTPDDDLDNDDETPATDDEPSDDDGDLSDDDVPEEEQQAFKSWQGRLRKKEQELQERENALKAAKQPEGETEETDSDSAGDDADTEGEDEDIQAFLEDFPEMEGPLKKMIQREVAQATAPVLENVSTLTADQEKQRYEEHVSAITSKHEDFGEIVESGVLESWIEELPYKDAVKYKAVCESGQAPEVIEMLDRYKQDNRKGQKQEQLRRRRDSQKRAGAAVPNHSSRVSNTSGNADPEDYDAGWDEAED